MRKVLVSSLILSLCLGFADDSNAKRRVSARASKRSISSSVVRGRGNVATTSTTSTTSSSSTDITSSTHRFIADSMNYDTKLMYGVKYDLASMLLPSVSSYYKTNGSEVINEKLCFGPYMTVTGIASTGSVVSYTADGGFECQPLQAGYSYTLELKEANKDQLKSFPFSRMLKITRLSTETNSDVDIAYMQFDYENFVNVSDFIPKITTAVAEAKAACSLVSADMNELKDKLGWSTGFSTAGMVLSGGATGVGVYNVVKTNQMDGQLKSFDGLDVKGKDESKECKKEVESTFSDSTDVEKLNYGCLIAYKEYLNEEMKDSKPSYDDTQYEEKVAELDEVKDYEEFKRFVDNDKFEAGNDFVFKECLDSSQDKIISGNNADAKCKDIAESLHLVISSKEDYDDSEIKLTAQKKDASEKAKRDLLKKMKANPENYAGEKSPYAIFKSKLIDVDKEISKKEDNNAQFDQKVQLSNNIDKSMKTTRVLDWVQAGLSSGSLATSGISFALSGQAFGIAKSALEHLNDCENKVSALNILYNEYNAEVESYGDEE